MSLVFTGSLDLSGHFAAAKNNCMKYFNAFGASLDFFLGFGVISACYWHGSIACERWKL